MKIPPTQKASEPFNTSQSDVGKSPIIGAFPQLTSIEARWRTTLLGIDSQRHRNRWHVVPADCLYEYLDCADALCSGGGFRIGAIVSDMVAANLTHQRGRGRCKGQKGPAGKLRWRLCVNVFEYEVRLVYKEVAGHLLAEHVDRGNVSHVAEVQ